MAEYGLCEPYPFRRAGAFCNCMSTREISEFLGFCVAAVRRVRQQFRQRRSLQPRTHLCGRKTLLTAGRKDRLEKLLSE